jgi:hypothetical protein
MLKVSGKDLSSTGDSARSAPIVFIRGATGLYSLYINGLFDPTEEKSSDGRVVYKKRDHANTIIEHFKCRWQIKDVSQKDSLIRFAEVGGCCELQACKWQPSWKVLEYRDSIEQETVKIFSGAEAEAQASSLDARARQRNPPPPLPRPSPAHGVPSDALCLFLPSGGRILCRHCACCC